MSYCEYINTITGWALDLNKTYHDEKYGFPIILRKEAAFRIAYDKFDIETIANYTETEEARLLSDPGIIRNRLKVKAAIHNAQVIMELKKEYGSFKSWLDHHSPVGRSSMSFC